MISKNTIQITPHHENSFNAIRFFCCLVVIFGHCLDLSHSSVSYRKFIDMGLCVRIFFILSGFWVFQSYLKSTNLKEYFSKRIIRLLPMYYIAVFGYAIICSFFSNLRFAEYFRSIDLWKYLFWNCIYLNFVHPSLPGVFDGGPVNGALWTIKVEIGFYIVLPFIAYLFEKLAKKKSQNLLLVAIYILSVFWNLVLEKFSSDLHLPAQLAHQLPGFMSFFVSGMVFVINWDFFMKKLNIMIIPAIICIILHYILKTELILPFALTVIVMFVGVKVTFLKNIGRPLDFSYGMYLFHFPLIQIAVVSGYFKNNVFVPFIFITSTVFFVTFISEKYIQKNIAKLMDNKKVKNV